MIAYAIKTAKSFLLLFIISQALVTNSLAAENTDTCYSVQLASIYNKNSIYLKLENYPSSCKLISLTNLKAIRCGCFNDKEEALISLRNLRKKHHGSIIVRTYKSRFIQKPDIAELEHTKEDETFTQEEPKVYESTQEVLDETTKSDDSQARFTPVDLWIRSFVQEGDLSIQGYVGATAQSYLQKPGSKHSYNVTMSGELDIEYTKDDLSLVSKLYVQADSHDIQGSSDKNNRSFARIDELFIKQDFEDDQIMFGQSIRFWGALEARNITDVFNPADLRSDIFNSDKLGVINLAYTHYTETGELSLIVKMSEPDRKMAGFPYVYYFFPETINSLGGIPLDYSDSLNKKAGERPSFFLKYSGSTDTEYPWDYSLIYENGYDSQRFYTYEADSEIPTNVTKVTTQENVYLVNKLISYNTIVVGSTLVKIEGVYTDVIDTTKAQAIDRFGVIQEKEISDYYHIGLGVEHTLTQVYSEGDLGLIAEYYKYETLAGGDTLSDLDIFEIFQNDLFIGGRYSFNEGDDASILAGVIYDLDYNEEVYSFEYESRMAEIFKLKFSYYYINPSSSAPTAYALIGDHQRLSINLGYYF